MAILLLYSKDINESIKLLFYQAAITIISSDQVQMAAEICQKAT